MQDQILKDHCALYRAFQNIKVFVGHDESDESEYTYLDDYTAEILASQPEILRTILEWGADASVIKVYRIDSLSGYTTVMYTNKHRKVDESMEYRYIHITESRDFELGVQAHGMLLTSPEDGQPILSICYYAPQNSVMILTQAAVAYGLRA